MARFPLAEWQAEQIRLTVFPMPDATARSVVWWETVTGTQPDETTMSPKKGTGVIQGPFDPGRLILRWEPDRIDWIFAATEPDINQIIAAREFSTIGPATEAIRLFSTVAERWLTEGDVPEIARMALGAVLIHPEPDRQTAYLRLPDYIPVRVNPDSSDFLYQINLPLISSTTGIDGMRLNRLSKWSAIALKSVSLRFGDTAVQAQRVAEMVGFRLELDINTTPDFPGPIPRGRLVDLYREFFAIAEALASNGVAQ